MERVLTPSLAITYPLYSKNNIERLFRFFSPIPLLDKRKVGGDSCLPQHLWIQNTNQYNSRFYHRITWFASESKEACRRPSPSQLKEFTKVTIAQSKLLNQACSKEEVKSSNKTSESRLIKGGWVLNRSLWIKLARRKLSAQSKPLDRSKLALLRFDSWDPNMIHGNYMGY